MDLHYRSFKSESCIYFDIAVEAEWEAEYSCHNSGGQGRCWSLLVIVSVFSWLVSRGAEILLLITCRS